MTLAEIYHSRKKDYNGATWPDMATTHSYLEVYSEILEPYRKTAKNILEIGLFTGDRLRVWEDYFTGKVYGIDCDIQPHGGLANLKPMIDEGTHNIFIMDATDIVTIKWNFPGTKFDVIIEDAGHDVTQQLQLYKAWKPYLSENGIYIIEDVQNIDRDEELFENIDSEKSVTTIDLRSNKGRYDDVLVVIK